MLHCDSSYCSHRNGCGVWNATPWLASSVQLAEILDFGAPTIVAAVTASDAELSTAGTIHAARTELKALLVPDEADQETRRRAELAASRYRVARCRTQFGLLRAAARAGRLLSLRQLPTRNFADAVGLLCSPAWTRRLFRPLTGVLALIVLIEAVSLAVHGLNVPWTEAAIPAGVFSVAALPLIARDLRLRARYARAPGERLFARTVQRAPEHAHYPQALVGYRGWRVDCEGVLLPLFTGAAWNRGVNHARCERPHAPPDPYCHCGYNAYDWISDVRSAYNPPLIGAIIAGGEVQVHRDGFRCELATPVALLAPRSRRLRACAQAAAERYGIPLVSSTKALAELALRTGALPAPAASRPPARWRGSQLLRFCYRALPKPVAWCGTAAGMFALVYALCLADRLAPVSAPVFICSAAGTALLPALIVISTQAAKLLGYMTLSFRSARRRHAA